jgi:hypothetical protein
MLPIGDRVRAVSVANCDSLGAGSIHASRGRTRILHDDLGARHRRGTLLNLVVDQRCSDRREHLLFGLVTDREPGHNVAGSAWSTREPLAWQTQCD